MEHQPGPVTGTSLPGPDVRSLPARELPRTLAEVQRVDLGGGEATTVAVFQGPAGPSRAHIHRWHDEVAVLVVGAGTITVAGQTAPITAGDVVTIPMGVVHSAIFTEPFQMLSIYGPADDPAAPDRDWV